MKHVIRKISFYSLTVAMTLTGIQAAEKGAPVPTKAVVKLDMQEGKKFHALSVRTRPTRLKDRVRDAKEIVIGGISHDTPIVLESERSGSYGKIDLYNPINAKAVKLESEDLNHKNRYAYISLSFLQSTRYTSELSERCVEIKEGSKIIAERSSEHQFVEEKRSDNTYKLTGYVRGKYYQVRVSGDLFENNQNLVTGYVTRNSIVQTLQATECSELMGEDYHDLSWGYVQGYWQDKSGRVYHIFANAERELQVIHYQYSQLFDGEGSFDPVNLNGEPVMEAFRGSSIERSFNLYLSYLRYIEKDEIQASDVSSVPMKLSEGLAPVNLRPYFYFLDFVKSTPSMKFEDDGLYD